jgi:hypothetical protein
MNIAAIADPRIFADIRDAPPADAALYALAAQSLGCATAREADSLRSRLRAALAARLRSDAASLATLLDEAPSVDVARTLWRELDIAWRDVVGADAIGVTIFALPIVVIAAGVHCAGALPGVIPDTGALDAVLREHGALRGNATLALANALVAPDALDFARLPDVLSWHAPTGADDRIRTLAPAPIAYSASQEGVHARLLVGSAIAAARADPLGAAPDRRWAIAFTRELVRQLAHPDATVLALPAPPQRPLPAVRQARTLSRDVAAQLFAANALRAIRTRSGEPIAIISAHRAADARGGGELRVSLSSPFDPRQAEGFRCALHPLERAADVARSLVSLLHDCRVADVRVLAGVHPDRSEGSSLRLLFKPDAIPTGKPSLH